ncbi:uncharacterized protein LOC111631978 [Centruroides sculpturatus]|uniref:uncharacterized protein LOC111631978 n=1 Tax=Centruroides sculpturatus TaxID=218467 RepID=UPI000C6D91F5|nr:uncharacterized protein LOC111631978 [Centruroides sculpturatus]
MTQRMALLPPELIPKYQLQKPEIRLHDNIQDLLEEKPIRVSLTSQPTEESQQQSPEPTKPSSIEDQITVSIPLAYQKYVPHIIQLLKSYQYDWNEKGELVENPPYFVFDRHRFHRLRFDQLVLGKKLVKHLLQKFLNELRRLKESIFHGKIIEIYLLHSISSRIVWRRNKPSKSNKVAEKNCQKWLSTQDTYTLHKPVRINYTRRKTKALYQGELFQSDLMDVRQFSKVNNGIKYLLSTIDAFSKYAHVIPVKDKKPETIKEAFQKIFRKIIPRFLHTDKGKEFMNSVIKDLFKKHQINHYYTHSETKASIVERFNKTLKNKIYRLITYRNSNKYIDKLNDLVRAYNNSTHRSIGMSPAEVKPKHHSQIFNRLYGKTKTKIKYKFKIDDRVRVSKKRKTFTRGYLPGWSKEIFIIKEQHPTNPVTYVLKDYNNNTIKGRFYNEELQKVKNG